MKFDVFRELLAEMVDEIPAEFLSDLQAVLALEKEHPEEEFDGVWRMGEYLDVGPDHFLGPAAFGRQIVLYHGSFKRIAEGDPGFDWEAEMWETLTHELRHHVESLAGDASLIGQDELDAREFRRRDG